MCVRAQEYMAFRGHRYIRLDGSSKLEDRRDMVEDWQTQYVALVLVVVVVVATF